jgi:hypothetical protein
LKAGRCPKKAELLLGAGGTGNEAAPEAGDDLPPLALELPELLLLLLLLLLLPELPLELLPELLPELLLEWALLLAAPSPLSWGRRGSRALSFSLDGSGERVPAAPAAAGGAAGSPPAPPSSVLAVQEGGGGGGSRPSFLARCTSCW